MLNDSDETVSVLYGAAYYASHCGPVPYLRNEHWLGFFGNIADVIVRSFAPKRVFDAGCGLGMLVECLWDRGVEAHGRDISDWAISQARADVRPWCAVGSLVDPIEGEYDLITCIEVLEHIAEDDALHVIASLAASAPRILFSSTPTDLDEPTHINVRPTSYWLSRWAEVGFAASVTHDAGYIAPHAYLLERSDEGRSPRDIVAFADRIRHRVALAQTGGDLRSVRAELSESERGRLELQAALAQSMAQTEHVRATWEVAVREARDASLRETEMAGRERELRCTAERELARARAELDGLSELLQSAQVQLELAQRQGQSESASQTSAWLNDIELAESRARAAQMQLDVILASTSWRAARRLGRAARVIPRPLRIGIRRLLRLVWWTVTLQLGQRLRDRAAGGAVAARIAASPLFDAGWYLSRNTDVAASGLSPAGHYARFGAREGRDPGPRFSVAQYLARHPEAAAEPRGAFLHAIAHGQEGDGTPGLAAPGSSPGPQGLHPPATVVEAADADPADGLHSVESLLAARFPDLTALPVFSVPDLGNRRLTVVTDSIGGGSLYGGVGTALVLAALAARRMGAELRLVTRTEPADAVKVAELLKTNNIPWDAAIETLHAPRGAGAADADVPVSSRDIVLTTSWWTTWSTRQSVPAAQIVCLVQEDERMFYPLGDDYLRCAETLANPDLTCLVNSRLLLDHFQADGLMAGATAFEPSFPRNLYFIEDAAASAARRRSFFFYARPHNSRNLYWRGLEAVSAAIDEGLLNPEEWDVYFAGHGGTELVLPKGVRPIIPGPMAWADYAAFIRRIDVGLSLMYTPHPSYPPIDIVASGGIAVTNRFGRKDDLGQYSPNILCSDLDVPSLVQSLRSATRLAADRETRVANFGRNALQRDWAESMSPAIDRVMLVAGS
jgi:SAM-dependent methyltransferase